MSGSVVFLFIILLRISFATKDGNASSPLPNVILIVTDDQDVVLKGMVPMKNVKDRIAHKGATFTNAFTSSPICCPSRASILSGQFAHNCATVNNSISGGCYGDFWRQHVEPRSIAAVAQSMGMETFFAGKYLNEYHGPAVPPRWTNFYGLVGNSKYYNYSLNENGKISHYPDQYLTDVIKERALEYIDAVNQPFFMYLAPPAPHSPYTPAKRHENEFPEIRAERTPNFNLASGDLDKHWLLTMPPKQLPESVLNTVDEIARKRWQSLLAVDELVGQLLDALEERHLLENTFLMFTSDNGYHLGQFGQAYDKRQPYETDIRIPLVVRGPRVAEHVIVNTPTLLLDLFPTILEMIGLAPFDYLDGRSFYADLMHAQRVEDFRELQIEYDRHLLVEHWGEFDRRQMDPECQIPAKDKVEFCTVDAACHCQDSWNNTYTCLRHMRADDDILYCQFHDAQHFVEIYNLAKDPYEMENLIFDMLPSQQADYALKLSNLANCLGASCKQYDRFANRDE